jgi:hypothetical protein
VTLHDLIFASVIVGICHSPELYRVWAANAKDKRAREAKKQ